MIRAEFFFYAVMSLRCFITSAQLPFQYQSSLNLKIQCSTNQNTKTPSYILDCPALITHIIVLISMFRCLPLKRIFQVMGAKLTGPVLPLLFRSLSPWKSKHRDIDFDAVYTTFYLAMSNNRLTCLIYFQLPVVTPHSTGWKTTPHSTKVTLNFSESYF